MSGVFISYRRNDSSWFARSLFDALRAAFPRHAIFIDVEGIDAGLDFVDVINDRLSSCEVLLTIIGRKWLEEITPDGRRRIDDPDDNVRVEIEAALRRKIRVIPVLVDGAQIPSQRDLPESLASLSRRNGLEITHARFSSDTTRLVDVLSSVLSNTPQRAAKPRKAVGRRRWMVAGGATLIPMMALSAVFVVHTGPSFEVSSQKLASATPSASYKTAASVLAEPSVKTGRSTATASDPTTPAPEASVPFIFPGTYGATNSPAPPTAIAGIEPEKTQSGLPTTLSEPAAFKRFAAIDVVETAGLDTNTARARLRIGSDRYVSRKAQCESLTINAEFGSFSLVDRLVEKRPSDKGDACFFKTSWKDHQSGAIADNTTAETPKILNQTLRLLCPSTYGDIVKDCQAY